MLTLSSPVSILHWQRGIIRSSALTAAEKAVAMALALRINSKSGKAWPSLERLADDACQSVSVAARAISKLIKLGFITAQRTGRTSIYRLRSVASGNSDLPVAATERAKVKNKALSSSTPESECMAATPESALAAPEPEPELETAPEADEAALAAADEVPADEDAPVPAADTADVPADVVAVDEAAQVIKTLNRETGTQHPTDRPTATRKLIQQRLDSGVSVEDMVMVICYCSITWSKKQWATAHALFKDEARFESLHQAALASKAASGPAAKKLLLPLDYIKANKWADEDIEGADTRLAFEIRTGQRPKLQRKAA